MRNFKASLIAALVITPVLQLPTTPAFSDDWPTWRGPAGDGHSPEKNLPTKWSATENVRWKTPLPGPGNSSPIVWGKRVFITQSLDKGGHERALICFDRRDGRELWRRVLEFAGKESTYDGEPHYCSASPVTDGRRVVASFGSAGVMCWDLNGKELWRRDLGKCEFIWGNASSPIIYGDLVILNFGPGERTFLVALNKATGKDVWRAEIPGGKYGSTQPDWIGSWSTPVITHIGKRDELIMSWPSTVKAYNPKTGEEIWSCGGMSKLVYTSPLVTPNVIVAMSGFGGSYLALKPDGKGDVTEANRLWREDRKVPQRVGGGVIVGEHIYILNEPGTAQCIELATGKTLWVERAGNSNSWGSMVATADGKLFATNRAGETIVLAAKPTFELLGVNPLGEKCNASPAISDSEIFVRTWQHLWCISSGK